MTQLPAVFFLAWKSMVRSQLDDDVIKTDRTSYIAGEHPAKLGYPLILWTEQSMNARVIYFLFKDRVHPYRRKNIMFLKRNF